MPVTPRPVLFIHGLLDLTDSRAVVTGASKGIGLAVTQALVAEGARVVAGSRTLCPALTALVDGGRVRHVPVDLSKATGPAELVEHAQEDGAVDVLVNNVGAVTPRLDGFLAVTDEDWESTFNLTFMAAMRATDLWLGEHGVAATVADHQGGEPGTVSTSAVAGTVTGRFTEPREVADLVVLLAGGRAGNVTGSDFLIDGGLLQTIW